MSYFDEFIRYIEDHGLEKPIGCTNDEIIRLEDSLGYSLPSSYKEFLSLLGKDYDGVMVGTNCFISDINSNNEYLPELLQENNLSHFIPTEKYLAFFCHQGYMMAWFSLPAESENPLCMHFFEGSTKEPKVYGTFSEFMETDLLGNAKLKVGNRLFDKLNRK